MWFKNLLLYRLRDASPIDAETIDQALDEHAAAPLGSNDARRIGWAAPAGRNGSGQMLHEVNGHRLLTALKQERLLPASVVADAVQRDADAIEENEGRKVTRKEKAALKEEVTEALLPHAFVKTKRIDVWWDTERQLIGIDTPSRPVAEDVLDLLRETLGSLKVTPLATSTLPARMMTAWLVDPASRPADLVVGDSVVLKAKGDDGVFIGRKLDPGIGDVIGFIETGWQATQLSVEVEGRLSLVLRDDLTFKSLRFGDALLEEADHADDGDDPLARLETDFVLMAGCLRQSTDRILEWLGGEAQPQSHQETE